MHTVYRAHAIIHQDGVVVIKLLHPKVEAEHLGLLPYWLNTNDERPAKEQLHEGYSNAGGWQPFKGFELLEDDSLEYPDDPPLHPIAEIEIHKERVLIYDHSWVAIIQPDRSFEVCRMD